MKIGKQEPFEKPQSGEYIGTLIDVIEKPQQPVTFGGVTKLQDQITFVWVVNYPTNQPAVDSKGRPFQIFETYNAFINDGSKPSKLYTALVQILNAAPPVIDDAAQIEGLVLGRACGLMVLTTPKTANPKELTTKVIGHMPLKPGQVAPQAPQGFVRAKNRTKTQTGQNGQPVQTYATPQAAAAAAPAPSVNLNNTDESF